MGRLLATCFLICSSGLPLAAADWPAAELYAGPSLMRIAGQDLLGGKVGIAVNRWQHVSFVGMFGYYQGNAKLVKVGRAPGRCDDDNGHPSDQDGDHDRSCPAPLIFVSTGLGDVYTYLGGARLRRTAGRITVFAEGAAGGARIGSQNGLAVAAGGGVQVGITQRFAVEAQVGYIPMRIAGEWSTDNVQATVGIVVRFGPWWGGYRKP